MRALHADGVAGEVECSFEGVCVVLQELEIDVGVQQGDNFGGALDRLDVEREQADWVHGFIPP